MLTNRDEHQSIVNVDQYRRPSQNWVGYILKCRGNALYAGRTNNIQRRLTEHFSKRGCKFTRAFPPLAVVELHFCRDLHDAIRWESQAFKDLRRQFPTKVIGGTSRNPHKMGDKTPPKDNAISSEVWE